VSASGAAARADTAGAPILEAHELTKTFGELKAVDRLSFQVKRGEVFAFLGPNGAGKTTTIRMLTTLLRPTSGEVRVGGHDPTRNADAVRRTIGIVFQDPSIDDELTAWENLEFHGVLYHVPRALREERMQRLLELVGLWDRRDDLLRTYSGGMRRRLEIARGLLHHPSVLFLDEPTLGLDPQTRHQMWEQIRALNESEAVTVFFSTHYMEEAERAATRVAIIDHGRIVAEGTPQELKASQGASTLEEAFLALTGHGIREEEMGSVDRLRMHGRVWRRR
jgi:ABC-2 type transport system ATP-binding protein